MPDQDQRINAAGDEPLPSTELALIGMILMVVSILYILPELNGGNRGSGVLMGALFAGPGVVCAARSVYAYDRTSSLVIVIACAVLSLTLFVLELMGCAVVVFKPKL